MNTPGTAPLAAPLRDRRWYSHEYNRGGYYRLASFCARSVPRRVRLALAPVMARLALRSFPRERESVRRNLARVLGGSGAGRLEATVFGVFKNFVICFGDLLTLNRTPVAALHRAIDGVQGEEHLTAASRAGRGLIVATAHLGNWELGGRLLAAKSGRATHVVLAVEEDRSLEALLRQSTDSVRFVTRGSPMISLELLAALRRDETVAVQADRATGGRADVWISFFGAPAAFPLGPFLLARAAGAPVLPAFCIVGKRAAYRIVLGAPIWVEPSGEEAGLRKLVAVIEQQVSDYPEQWFNFYDFWGPTVG